MPRVSSTIGSFAPTPQWHGNDTAVLRSDGFGFAPHSTALEKRGNGFRRNGMASHIRALLRRGIASRDTAIQSHASRRKGEVSLRFDGLRDGKPRVGASSQLTARQRIATDMQSTEPQFGASLRNGDARHRKSPHGMVWRRQSLASHTQRAVGHRLGEAILRFGEQRIGMSNHGRLSQSIALARHRMATVRHGMATDKHRHGERSRLKARHGNATASRRNGMGRRSLRSATHRLGYGMAYHRQAHLGDGMARQSLRAAAAAHPRTGPPAADLACSRFATLAVGYLRVCKVKSETYQDVTATCEANPFLCVT